jgi:hypothetical protein
MKFGLKHPDIYKGLASHAGAFEFWTFFDPYWKNAILAEYPGPPPYTYDPNAGQSSKGAFAICGAFSPNLNNPPYYVDFILDSNGDIDPSAKAAWELHNPAYLATLLPSEADLAIYFDCGKQDEHAFYPANVKFSEILAALNIPHVFESFVGGHYNKIPERERIELLYLDSVMQEIQLVTDIEKLSASIGGSVALYLSAGWDNGNRNYILLGSVTGTDPGTPLPGGLVTLPLNWDVFTDFVISLINTPVFLNFMGTLDATGSATAQLNAPPVPGFAGVTMHYAYALNQPWNFVSNPIAVEIVN